MIKYRIPILGTTTAKLFNGGPPAALLWAKGA